MQIIAYLIFIIPHNNMFYSYFYILSFFNEILAQDIK
jgi:hypothetical protein